MKVMQIATYPMTSMEEAVDVFLDIAANDPMPDYMTMESSYTHWGGDGIKSYMVYDIAEARADDGLNELVRRTVRFASIEGYKVESQMVLPLEAALSHLGKKMPNT